MPYLFRRLFRFPVPSGVGLRWIRPLRPPSRGPHLVCRLHGCPCGGSGLPRSRVPPPPVLPSLPPPLPPSGGVSSTRGWTSPPPPPAPPQDAASPRPSASGRVDALVDLGPPWLGWFGFLGCRDEASWTSFLHCLFMFPKRCENFVFVSFRTWLAVCLWSGGVGWGGWGWVGGLGSFGVGFGLGWFGVGLGRCGVAWGLANMRLNPTSWKGCVAR